MLKINLDRERCIGTENCHAYAPHTFATDDTSRVMIIGIDADDEESIRTAIASCPVSALAIAESEDEE